MRIKFKKGLLPETIIDILSQYIGAGVIGSVNVYIQEYDENMNAIKDDGEYTVAEPTDAGKKLYADYVATQRRKRMKVVV